MTETRVLTLFDQKYPVNLRDRPPLSWRRIPPTGFRAVNFVGGPDESVEIFAGRSRGGTRGDALKNANRWWGQFGLSPAPDESIFDPIDILVGPEEKIYFKDKRVIVGERISETDTEYVVSVAYSKSIRTARTRKTFKKSEIEKIEKNRPFLVEAKGTYNPGMGADPREGFALLGAILRESGGDLLTFKMVGPAEAVKGMRKEFIAYCESLENVDVNLIEEESETPES